MTVSPESFPRPLAVQLLDASHGGVIQSWQFDSQTTVTLGRSSERDIRLGDQHVSRLHAELQYEDGQWWAVSRGKSGLLVNGEKVERCELSDRAVIRLGAMGPSFSICFDRVNDDTEATFEESRQVTVQLKIDEEKKAREVSEIAEGDYFRHLRAKANELRKHS